MAKIILQRDEEFEHFHSLESKTILLEGDVELSCKGDIQKLRVNMEVVIPAKIAHTVKNVGNCQAVIECQHVPR